MQIGILIFPAMNQLDATGPYEVLARLPSSTVHLIAKRRENIRTEWGLAIAATTTIAEAPALDLICIPGGRGVNALLEDDEILSFVQRQGGARFITSVCTGALVLGAAGLLRGYKATTHWLSLELLPILGAEPVPERVVVDRNRITGGGVTAGLDFALTVAGEVAGETFAREVQLLMEYDPAPPFRSGSPTVAHPALVARVRKAREGIQDERRQLVTRAAARLGPRLP